jgi:hypothetical protein
MSQPHSLYWIGLYEPECSEKWEWFFQVDLTRAICYFVLRFMGGGEEVLCLLLYHRYYSYTDGQKILQSLVYFLPFGAVSRSLR